MENLNTENNENTNTIKTQKPKANIGHAFKLFNAYRSFMNSAPSGDVSPDCFLENEARKLGELAISALRKCSSLDVSILDDDINQSEWLDDIKLSIVGIKTDSKTEKLDKLYKVSAVQKVNCGLEAGTNVRSMTIMARVLDASNNYVGERLVSVIIPQSKDEKFEISTVEISDLTVTTIN